ncbi:anti-sigma factor [Streptomyces dysideae]|uniref:hypothetical protein n=1 Tax=Streptomyces dysideae TaxID=909626 RepID=UPI000A79F5DE|nr:hypothetical protein [Streptomyces dysideae]
MSRGPAGSGPTARSGSATCGLRSAVGSYADGQLTGAPRARVAGHVARCWTCSGELLALRLIKTSVRDHPRRAPASLAEARIRRFADRLTDVPTPRH